jgi:hypothetical protein
LKHYIFSEGIPASGYEFDFEQSLFNLEKHRLLQSPEGWMSFFVLNEKKSTVSAALHFHIKDNEARSPLKGTFGSVEFAEELPPRTLFTFLEFAETQLINRGVKKITIKLPPHLTQDRSALIHVFLFNMNYSVVNAEVGAIVQVHESSFNSQVHAWEKRRLRQAKAGKLRFRELEKNKLKMVYNFILKCRDEKGYNLSMTYHELQATVAAFPERYLIFGVFNDNDELAAASIAIAVNKKLLYNFYSAHDKKYDQLSPAVMLIEGIYDFANENNIGMIDLGTSAIGDKPNFRLLNFKLHLGAEATPKFTFEKNLYG